MSFHHSLAGTEPVKAQMPPGIIKEVQSVILLIAYADLYRQKDLTESQKQEYFWGAYKKLVPLVHIDSPHSRINAMLRSELLSPYVIDRSLKEKLMWISPGEFFSSQM